MSRQPVSKLKKSFYQPKKISENLTPWQRVQLSRHPQRPYTMDYIQALSGETFLELHGDRTVKDDKAMVGGFGKIGDQSFLFIGQQKGIQHKKHASIETLGWPIPRVTAKPFDL